MNVQSFYPTSMQRVPEGRTTLKDQFGSPYLQMDRDESEIAVQTLYPQNDFRVRGDQDSVLLDYRLGGQFDVAFQRSGQDIFVDRPGVSGDFAVRRDESSVTIDRPGPYNDVLVRFGPNRIDVNTFDPTQRVSIERRGEDVFVSQGGFLAETYPAKLFPGGWPSEPTLSSVSEYTGLDERTSESLDRWAKTGIDKDDIVRVDRQGQLYTFESYYQ
mgnify:CR=1 FL=1